MHPASTPPYRITPAIFPRVPSGLKFVGVREFKGKLTGYLGDGEEVVITRHGKPIARVVPVGKGSPENLLLEIGMGCTILEPAEKGHICRDPKDDAYLHLCIAAEADFLITGDKDLLAVDPGKNALLPGRLRIVTPRQYLEDYE